MQINQRGITVVAACSDCQHPTVNKSENPSGRRDDRHVGRMVMRRPLRRSRLRKLNRHPHTAITGLIPACPAGAAGPIRPSPSSSGSRASRTGHLWTGTLR